MYSYWGPLVFDLVIRPKVWRENDWMLVCTFRSPTPAVTFIESDWATWNVLYMSTHTTIDKTRAIFLKIIIIKKYHNHY